MSELGYRIKKTSFFGWGAFLQLIGVLVFFGLILVVPIGTLFALIFGPACFFKGSGLAVYWACSRCGERLPSKTVEICRGCSSSLGSKKQSRRAAKEVLAG